MLMTRAQLDQFARRHERAVDCPVCENARFRLLLSPDQIKTERDWLDDFHRTRGGLEGKDKIDFTQDEFTCVVECSQCGTLLRNPRPDESALHERYERDHYTDDDLIVSR
jgi:hypothetical protein